ncbi:four helix bundle protein [Bacteroidota bacterium]|nr:four helix bundle protein [Bacteroidota bacterium]
MHSFKDLIIWQKSRAFVKDIYLTSSKFPSEEKFGIISQIRRAVISISANISEGAGKNSDADFCRFLDTSLGSSNEVENLIFLCFDLEFINESKQKELLEKVIEIQRMLGALILKIRNKK